MTLKLTSSYSGLLSFLSEKKASFGPFIDNGLDFMLALTLVTQESNEFHAFGVLFARSVPMFAKTLLNSSAISFSSICQFC